jgi:putative serine protease XkdF
MAQPQQFEKAGEFHKTSDGIAYGWAVVSTIDGTPYQDLQGDYIPADTIPAVAADFMMRARVGKDMHTGDQVADVLFAWPATDEINKGVEYSGRKTGLLIGWRPYDKALLDKIAAGERVGFSIGGELHESDTETVGKFSKAATGAAGTAQRRTFRAWKLNEISLVDVPAQEHALVGVVKSATGAAKLVIASAVKAVWSTAEINDLPDSSFLYIESGGEKDDAGKTTPRSLRHFPYKDAEGKIDLPHLRNAISRIPQSSLPQDVRDKLQVRAETLLGAQHQTDKAKARKKPKRRGMGMIAPAAVGAGAASEPYKRVSKGSGFAPGDRVNVPLDKAHMPDASGAGTVTIVDGNALGITFDRNPSVIHRWYTVDEIEDLEPDAMKRVSKMAVLTSVTDGHQHTLDLDAPADCWSDTLMTSYQTSEGATEGHCHAWVYDATTGAITIALDSGHSHTVDAVVPADVIAAAAADDDEPDAVPCTVCDEPSAPAPTVVVVANRAPQGVSTPPAVTPTVKTTEEPTAMPDLNDQIRDLQAQNARLQKMATLTDAQRVHFAKLGPNDAELFLAMRADQRDSLLAEIAKSDEVVYTTLAGREYRKSTPLEIIEAVKATDAANKLVRETEITRKNLEYAKRGDEVLTHFAKGAKGDLRARIMKALDTEFTVPAEHNEAMRELRGANAARVALGKAIGYDGAGNGPEANAPEQQLRAAVEKYQSDHKLPSYELALLKATESDANIRKLYDAAAVS